jgi:hypothetical protein
MCCKGFLKRFAPFFITLTLGLFVASFFVTVARPNIRTVRGWKSHREYHRRLEFENQRLREENSRLKRDAAQREAQQNLKVVEDVNDLVPPPPPLPVRPPAPYRK